MTSFAKGFSLYVPKIWKGATNLSLPGHDTQGSDRGPDVESVTPKYGETWSQTPGKEGDPGTLYGDTYFPDFKECQVSREGTYRGDLGEG